MTQRPLKIRSSTKPFFHLRSHAYLLADKAYSLEMHVIVPYKDPYAREHPKAAFNYQISIPRVKIEHAFGVLKGRLPSLRSLLVRIGLDQQQGHQRLYNWLHSMQDEEDWLEECVISSIQDNQAQKAEQ